MRPNPSHEFPIRLCAPRGLKHAHVYTTTDGGPQSQDRCMIALRVAPLISHRLLPERIKDAYDGLLHQPDVFTRVGLLWGG